MTTESAVEMRPDIPGSSTPGASRIWIVAAAAVPVLLYLLYVFYYSVDAPFVDDWSVVTLVHAAIHGHLSVSSFWSQYGDTRIVMGRLFFVLFGLLDHLDEKSVILFSAAIFIASYVVLLICFRSYLGRKLSFLSVLVLGMVWFSVVDAQNVLWSFQLSWYLATFFVMLTICSLTVPRHHRTIFFALAIAAAVGASFSYLQGLISWLVGLLCLLWISPRTRRTNYELAIWVSVASLVLAAFFHGYNFSNPACTPPGPQCSLVFGLSHPNKLIVFFIALVGDVVPSPYLTVHELVGLLICLVAGFVVFQSIRERRLQVNPLPLLLITFAVFFDLMTTLGRVSDGPLSAASPSRFTMPNVILLVGIVVYAWAHAPTVPRSRANGRPAQLRTFGLSTLIALLLVQCVTTTRYGLATGHSYMVKNEADARIVVDVKGIPVSERTCYVTFALFPYGITAFNLWDRLAAEDHLTDFFGTTERELLANGLPNIRNCNDLRINTVPLPRGQVGLPYSAPLTVTGGTGPCTWLLTRVRAGAHLGGLPAGLSLDKSTGVISGVPRLAGTFLFTVKVFDYNLKRRWDHNKTNLSITIS